MRSYKCAMQLWRKRPADLVGVLPKLSRAFQTQKTNSDRLLGMVKSSGIARRSTAHSSLLTRGIVGADAISVLSGRKFSRELINASWTPLQLQRNYNVVVLPRFSRTMSSEANSEKLPRNNNPQKAVLTFVAGASCIVIGILIRFGIASLLAYHVLMDWSTFESNGYLQDQQSFNMALIKRIQDDAKVREKIGHPIIGYGVGSRIRALREFIPSKFWTDRDGIEHVVADFYVRGPQGAGKVYTEMFRGKNDAKRCIE